MKRTPSPLTPRELAMLQFIAGYHAERGFAPGIREIGAAVGVDSTSLVSYHLGRLEDAGYLTHTPRVARSLILSDAGRELVAQKGA